MIWKGNAPENEKIDGNHLERRENKNGAEFITRKRRKNEKKNEKNKKI